MSKETKFRAWFYKKKTMHNVCSIDFSSNEVEFHDNDWIGWHRFDEVELMQYVGIKDRNGVKIFEGDIVKVDYLQEKIFEIIFVIGGFKLKAKDCSTEYDYSITSTMIEENAIEVIGNIYENPELLGE